VRFVASLQSSTLLTNHTITDAFDTDGTLTKPKAKAINKIGHYLHGLNPKYRSASLSDSNAAIATSLGFKDPRILQSMIICKQPEIGGRVPPHQDSTFLYTDPPSAVGFWYALEDATADNGCLSFAAGSHRRAPIRSRFVRKYDDKGMPTATGTGFEENDHSQWPAGLKEDTEVRKEIYELGEVKAGTLVLIHGNLLHKSEKNTSMKGRMIYTFHCIEGGNDYDAKNWLQPPSTGFSKLFQS
jgi:phytanoyl-CoA hydroxylase